MIRRLFYMALGAYAAVWTMRKLQSLRPDHVARRAAGRAAIAADQLRDFAGDVRRLSAGRETELRAEFGLDSVSRDSVAQDTVAGDRAAEDGVDRPGAGGNDDVKDGR